MKNILVSSFILLFLYPCAIRTYAQNVSNNAPLEKIENSKVVCVVAINDGAYGGKVYEGSGLYVLNILTVNLQPFTSKIITVNAEDYETEAKQTGATYIVKTTITNWEPRLAASALRGKPTRVEMNVFVFDLEQNKYIINTTLSAQGKTGTLASQSAEELATELIKEFVRSITK